MHIISQKRIKEGVEQYPETAGALLAWLKLMKQSNPRNFSELRKLMNSVDIKGEHHIFNIGGNKLRLIAWIDYEYKKVFVREILTHREYDKRKFV